VIDVVMESKEFVSVVVPAHNREGTIEEALESIVRQTHENWEAIVVDDGSTDGTWKRVARLQRTDPRIRLVRGSRNRGAPAARNAGIRLARGKWVAFLDSDDIYLPDSLKDRVGLALSARVRVVHSEGYVSKGGHLARREAPPFDGLVYREVLARPGPMFPTLLVERAALRRIGYLDERIVAYDEWDTAIRLARFCRFAFLPEPTFVWRDAAGNRISSDRARGAHGYEQVVRKHWKAILRSLGPIGLSKHCLVIAHLQREAGKVTTPRLWRLLAGAMDPYSAIRVARRNLSAARRT
jgi:glycosyltransferase involved in cell wall biosynthesis